jgi:AraC-like DNA-binding protein
VAAPEGSLVLCRPGAVDAFRWDMSQRTQHAFFHFQVQQFPEYWPDPDKWPLVRMPESDDIIVTLFRYIMTRAGRLEPTAGLLALELMLETFVSGESRVAAIPQTPLPEAVERAHRYLLSKLEREPRAPIPLGELARAAYVSPEHLCRLFKDSTGYSPLETVRLARLDRAATLLARTNYSVAEIASMTGFASPFHFSRKFKEAFGQAPRELRQAIRAGDTPPTPRLLRTQHNF